MDLIKCVRECLLNVGMAPKHVKMNGGAATFVVAQEEFAYSDLDLIFPTRFACEQNFEQVSTFFFLFDTSLRK